jgi:hypothetical protein
MDSDRATQFYQQCKFKISGKTKDAIYAAFRAWAIEKGISSLDDLWEIVWGKI